MKSRLEQFRHQNSLRQEDLAQLLGCTKSNISMIERGKSSVTKRNRDVLVQKFNLNPDWLDGCTGPGVDMYLPTVCHAVEPPDQCEEVNRSPAGIPLFDAGKIDDLKSLFQYTRENRGNIGNPQKRRGRKKRTQHMYEPKGWVSYPDMPVCDGALKVYIDGMSSVLGCCAMVLYSQLSSVAEIIWGKLYLVSIETSAGEDIVVRYLRRPGTDTGIEPLEKPGTGVCCDPTVSATPPKPDDHGRLPRTVILSTPDSDWADTEVELSKIKAIALVKASIRAFSTK